ncbi:hypothetical protein C8Q73DRAFT_646176 [Cubamyces lactineus]|nr:hypothetical protein C8Q73DRAFT_646176 [Cubamyces lactineus]
MTTFDAIVLPADGRPPHLVPLMISVHGIPPGEAEPYRCRRVPHPEVYMEYIAKTPGLQTWRYDLIEALDGMLNKFPFPYIAFYPILSSDGMPFPVNKCIREFKGERYDQASAWRGSIVIAKYKDIHYSGMMDFSMADFPIIKNYFITHPAPL